ncbi:MAG: ABC transporter permease [Deltaproteobacteria bacterium]|nr:ABC transporter permease [Deltaproteobacteria bacterium]MCL5878396.1 ABC transporter permease [Deltaproteobacteria bacterium]
MNKLTYIVTAFEALSSNKMRSALTMLGVIIGVASVILLVSMAEGAKQYILEKFTGLGTNLIIIQPGKIQTKGGSFPVAGIATTHKLTLSDVKAIERQATYVDGVFPMILGALIVKYHDAHADTTVVGVNEQFTKIISMMPSIGGFMTKEESDAGRNVCVLGYNIWKALFADKNPLGRIVKLGNFYFRVIGVMEKKGQAVGFDWDDLVYVPARAAEKLFNTDSLFGIRAKAISKNVINEAVAQITQILKKQHNNNEDFSVVTQESMLSTVDTIMNMMTIVLGGIAGISLLVGGIGIMNIMLVSIKERTREIGLRKAVGANKQDILIQFLIESATLSTTGGVIGMLIGIGGGFIMQSMISGFHISITLWSILLSFFFSAFVGIFFGVYPAYKAAQLDPIESLRYE